MKSNGKNLLVNELKDLGYTKYRISKEIGVAQNTVGFWDKGIWRPNEKNVKALESLRAKGKWNGR